MAKRICVVGIGRWGRNHVRTLNALGCLGGAVEIDRSVLQGFRQEYAALGAHTDLDEALNAEYDGYTIATPASTHGALAERIVEAGRPVLVEKPLALTAADARFLRDLAYRRGVTMMVGHLLLFHPAIRKIKEWLDAGRIGTLQYLYSNRLNFGTFRNEENILWSFAPHDVSIFQYLIGKRPTETVCRGGAYLDRSVEDSTMTVLSYPDGVVGHVFVSWLHPFKEHRLVVIGSRGMLVYQRTVERQAAGPMESQSLRFYERGTEAVRPDRPLPDPPPMDVPFAPNPPLTEELAYFADHLDRPIDIATGDSAVEVLEILEEATHQLRTQRNDARQG